MGAGNAQAGGHHEALAVVEHGLGEVAPGGVAGGGPSGVAGHHVHLAGLHGGAALGGGGGLVFHGIGVAQDGGGDGAAQVNVKALGVAVGVDVAETGQLGIVRAERRGRGRARLGDGCRPERPGLRWARGGASVGGSGMAVAAAGAVGSATGAGAVGSSPVQAIMATMPAITIAPATYLIYRFITGFLLGFLWRTSVAQNSFQ